MYCLPCFALLALLLATAKIHYDEQELLAGTKQSNQADKAVRLIMQAGLQGSWACLLCFVPTTSACSPKWILELLTHLLQSTFL
jgi:hypothetical protein